MQVQAVVGGPEEEGRRAVRVYARAGQDWTLYASGVLAVAAAAAAAAAADQAREAADFAVWPPRDAVPVPIDGLYEQLAAAGYERGPVFRGLAGVWRRGRRCSPRPAWVSRRRRMPGCSDRIGRCLTRFCMRWVQAGC